MAAAAEGHSEIADSLLQAGAEVNLSNTKGCTALIMAASNGSEGLYLFFAFALKVYLFVLTCFGGKRLERGIPSYAFGAICR